MWDKVVIFLYCRFLGEMPYIKLLHLVILKKVQLKSDPLDISTSHFMLQSNEFVLISRFLIIAQRP